MTHRGLSPHAFVYAPLSGKRHSCRFTMMRQCRSGRSAASPNRDFQLKASRDNNACAARPPQAASVRSSRRPTSEVGSLLFCCTFAHRFRVASFWFLVSGSFRSFTSPAIRHGNQRVQTLQILLVKNTTVYCNNFFTLRSDYGSTSNGDFIVRNCTFVPVNGQPSPRAFLH